MSVAAQKLFRELRALLKTAQEVTREIERLGAGEDSRPSSPVAPDGPETTQLSPASGAAAPQGVLDALDAWLEDERPSGTEITSEQVSQAEAWTKVRAYRDAL